MISSFGLHFHLKRKLKLLFCHVSAVDNRKLLKFLAIFSSRPYDEIVFPADSFVQEGAPNEWSHKFFDGQSRTADSVLGSIVDPNNKELKKRVRTFLDICLDV